MQTNQLSTYELHLNGEHAIEQMLKKDRFLLEIKAHERSISHKLGL